MKRKSNKQKKPQSPKKTRGSWLQDAGKFLVGLASVLKVIFDFVTWLLAN